MSTFYLCRATTGSKPYKQNINSGFKLNSRWDSYEGRPSTGYFTGFQPYFLSTSLDGNIDSAIWSFSKSVPYQSSMGNPRVLNKIFVSAVLPTGTNLSGSCSGQLKAASITSSGYQTGHFYNYAYLTLMDGHDGSYKGTLATFSGDVALPPNETNRPLPIRQFNSGYIGQTGLRLVLEVGAVLNASLSGSPNGSYLYSQSFGETVSGELPVDYWTTANLKPWIRTTNTINV